MPHSFRDGLYDLSTVYDPTDKMTAELNGIMIVRKLRTL